MSSKQSTEATGMAFSFSTLPQTPKKRSIVEKSSPQVVITACTVRRRRARLDDVVNTNPVNDLQVGGITVPRHMWRRDLRQVGIHRSVEYIIERLTLDGMDIKTLFEVPKSRRGEVLATLRPAGQLIPRLERKWPVYVTVSEGLLWSYKRDVATCAAVCVGLAASFIIGGMLIGELCGVYSIASESMVPTLIKHDAIFVEKLSIRAAPARRGEVVVIKAPPQLEKTAEEEGRKLRYRDALVKRVVATGGDIVQIEEETEKGKSLVRVNGKVVGGGVAEGWGKYMRVGTFRVRDGLVFLLGDNGPSSFDSRWFGCLKSDDVIGRPVARIFPPERFGVWGTEGSR